MRRLVLVLALLGSAPAGAADTPIVVSHGPEDVAITIASGDYALVREMRSVELPRGGALVQFRAVSDAIVPEAAAVEGLAGTVERNFDYDVLTPYTLVRKALGQRATRVRTDPGSGVVTREAATLTLRFREDRDHSSGDPLPAGTVRVTQRGERGEPLFVGEDEIRNTAAGLPVSLGLARARDVFDVTTITERTERLLGLRSLLRGATVVRSQARMEHALSNAKSIPVAVEIEQQGTDRIRGGSHPWTLEQGFPTWRLVLPPHSTTTLTYVAVVDEEE